MTADAPRRWEPGSGIDEVPPDLYGHFHHDPALRMFTGISRILLPLINRFAPEPVDPPASAGVTTLRITDRTVVAHDENVVALRMEALDGGEVPKWYPGAHIDLLLPSGRMREYSLCGDPTDRTYYQIAVRRIPDGGGGSREVHDVLSVGDSISIKGPRNAFPLAMPGLGSPATQLRFIAGGIGITPILPMISAADRFGTAWSMVYTGRSSDSLPFLDEVAAHGTRVSIRTDDDGGLPTAAELIGEIDAGTAVYCCGPVPMLEAIRKELATAAGVELHYERFSPPPVVDGNPFRVLLNSTGGEVDVAADETMLAALRRADPNVPYSCRQGFCGTCRLHVAAGEVDHRDSLLTQSERDAGWMLTCVSRAQGSSLTLDR